MAEQTATKEAPKEEVTRIKNCGTCNKPLKRVKRYYRDGKYYCNKNCWSNKDKVAEKKKE